MTRTVLQEEVKKLQRKLNKTIIFVTHDMEEAISLADVIIFMDKGEIAQIASPEEMLRNPANDLIRSFLGKHIHDNNETLTISSFLRTNIFKVGADRGILECTELMALHCEHRGNQRALPGKAGQHCSAGAPCHARSVHHR